MTDSPTPPQTDASVEQTLLPVSEQLLHSTIRIECLDASGQRSSGTGFHFRFRLDDEWVPAIVTNKHVLENARDVVFWLTEADRYGRVTDQHKPVKITNFSSEVWISHPDPEVDLVLLPIQTILVHLKARQIRPFYIDLAADIIPSLNDFDALDAFEEIITIGYPNGIWDEFNNRPIARRGLTATACNKNYRGKREFLIDAAVFPGSSGSPVFILNRETYVQSDRTRLGGRLLLVGIIYAVHLHTAQGEIITITAPTTVGQMAISQIPNGLGICIKASRLLEFEPAIRARVAAQKRGERGT